MTHLRDELALHQAAILANAHADALWAAAERRIRFLDRHPRLWRTCCIGLVNDHVRIVWRKKKP